MRCVWQNSLIEIRQHKYFQYRHYAEICEYIIILHTIYKSLAKNYNWLWPFLPKYNILGRPIRLEIFWLRSSGQWPAHINSFPSDCRICTVIKKFFNQLKPESKHITLKAKRTKSITIRKYRFLIIVVCWHSGLRCPVCTSLPYKWWEYMKVLLDFDWTWRQEQNTDRPLWLCINILVERVAYNGWT